MRAKLKERMKRIWHIVLVLLFVLPLAAQTDELCMEGTLLFREDFGGNSPEDPDVSRASVPGMELPYINSGNSLGSGHYSLRKEGWHNGIQWHWQDDHTYFGDKTRGYLLEVDGIGGEKAFYSKRIDGLCAGSQLTFSAYVVNVHYAGQLDYFGSSYVYPRMKFVLKDPETGVVLAEKSTGDIQPDWRYGTPETWKYARDNQLSAEWQLIGMNFTVPEGVESIRMYIYNDVAQNGSGNDFALDDIEIHLCAPPVTIEGENEMCPNSSAVLTAYFTNDGTFAEPLEYKWWFSADSLTWTELSETTNVLTLSNVQKADSGWYKVAVSGGGNIESVNCRSVSAPHLLHVKACEPPEPALCIDGILLFREDFGGNDPDDPRLSTTPVEGMSYTQLTSDRFGVMGAGKYLVTKSGYCNGDTSVNNLPQNRRSQWHLQDDHTYPNDRTRGYLLEIDARADNAAFYQTTIEHLCEGIELTFSAYVANVMTWGQYMGRPGMYAYPRLKFVLTNPTNNSELATYDTGDIPFDSAFINDFNCWQESSKWQLVGMNFTVPVGVEAIQLSIYNNVDNAIGNDFALDDIEIHLCMTPDTIRTDTTVCDTLSRITWHGKEFAITDTLRDTLRSYCAFDSIYYELHVERALCEKPDTKTDCYDPAQELHGFSVSADMKVVFAPGNLQYNPAQGSHLCADGTMQQGTWRFAENQWDYIGSHASASSTYNGWIDLYAWGTSGWSNGVEEYQPWSSTIGASKCYYINGDASLSMTGDYENADWAVYNSIGEYSPNFWRTLSAEEWEFILNGRTNASILCGKATINNVCGLIFLPDDYPFADLSLPQFIPGNDRFCSTNKYTESQWEQLENKGAVFLPAAGVIYGGNNNYPNIHGYYWSVSACNENKQSRGRAYNLEFYSDANYPSTQITSSDRRGGKSVRPVMDIPKNYVPTVKMDTTVCDTLLPITWRGHEWTETGVIRDTLQSICGTDSICLILSLKTETCCPDVMVQTYDTIVCDTLMPYRWRDTLFTEPARYEIVYKDRRNCDSLLYVLNLDTFHCERLWPIIVNKYNWQLLLDNVTLRKFFPNRTVTAYQWYKNDEPIPGANDDDYAEQNELNGIFQLRVTLDGNQIIWSNILQIITTESEAPIESKVYNWQNLYLIRYEQGDKVWTEKRLVP